MSAFIVRAICSGKCYAYSEHQIHAFIYDQRTQIVFIHMLNHFGHLAKVLLWISIAEQSNFQMLLKSNTTIKENWHKDTTHTFSCVTDTVFPRKLLLCGPMLLIAGFDKSGILLSRALLHIF